MRRLLLAGAAVLGLAAPAAAQTLPPAPVDPAATWTENGTAAGGRSIEAEVARGPLELAWTQELPGAGSGIAAVGNGVVLAALGTDPNVQQQPLLALDAATGRQLWQHLADDEAEVVFAGDRVIVAEDGTFDSPGEVRALDAATGAVVWRTRFRGTADRLGMPGAAGDLVVVPVTGSLSGEYELVALDRGDGRERWRSEGDGAAGRPVTDGERIYVGDDCGGASAFALDGRLVWRQLPGSPCVETGDRAAVGAGRLLTGLSATGHVWDADSGVDLGTFSGRSSGSSAGTTVFTPGTEGFSGMANPPGAAAVEAREAGAPAAAWTTRSTRAFGSPTAFDTPVTVADTAVAGSVVFVNAATGVVGLDRLTGRVLSSTPIVSAPVSRWSDGLDAIALLPGLLVTGRGRSLTALRGELRPAPGATNTGTSEDFAEFGDPGAVIWGALGEGVGRGRVRLQADRRPYGRFATAATGRPGPDGLFTFRVRPTRNTRYRLAAPGARRRTVTPVTVAPRVRVSEPRVRRATARVRITVRGPADLRAAGRTVVLYDGDQLFERRAVARLRGGPSRAQATVRYRLPRTTAPDAVLVACVRGAARAGFGSLDRFERRCGRRRIHLSR